MKIYVRKNPRSCEELSEFIGYPVREWIRHPDGRMEIDIDAELNPGEKLLLIGKLEQAQIHLVEGK